MGSAVDLIGRACIFSLLVATVQIFLTFEPEYCCSHAAKHNFCRQHYKVCLLGTKDGVTNYLIRSGI